MALETASRPKVLSDEEIVALCRRYTLYEWTAQAAADPIAVDHAKGVYFYSPSGKRYLDFNSQLMSVNAGHGDPRIIDAIKRQAEKLAYANPFMAHEPRARLGQKLAELMPGDLDKVFFTLGGAEANENAIRLARAVTGRHKVMARYRSYHGATAGAIALTGDPRRWANDIGDSGVVHVLDPYHGPERPVDNAAEALRYLEETIQLEGPNTIAAFFLETVTGTNGILIPPDGYLEGVRRLCDRYGILMVCDEIMSGFGRTGEWFAVDHWKVVPDLMTMAKGLTSSYVPLGAVAMRPNIAEHFEKNVFYGGLTYNSHPLACAAALGTIQAYEEDDMVGNARRMGLVMAGHHAALKEKHPSVGLTRSIGLFGILELVKNRQTMEPLAPFNATSEPMKAVGKSLRDHGLYTFVRWHTIMTNPPLCISEEQLAEGFAIIDKALEIADRAVS
ncbi:MAG: aminotransferase class III-fold pyridoxal phosphate-dependent enzyme [Chloroflexi bacterium]|nr:MAG: aminotransferase class III-fold pyridoxal phosphate-dependent enzyme [Chloroflexota bacterium]TME46759.1 MAG: aminotransferase class III-fold pyridoxal phosphate-dependent enzyme [Chloroflexota bacterium]